MVRVMPKKTILAAVSAMALLCSAAALADEADSYAQGTADWGSLSGWFNSQTGDRAAGANYWATNRNASGHLSCGDAASNYKIFGDKAAFADGCQEAKRRLDPIDDRRHTDPQYRLAFSDAAKRLPLQANAAVPSVPAPATSAPLKTQPVQTAAAPPPAPVTSVPDTGCGLGGKDPCDTIAAPQASDLVECPYSRISDRVQTVDGRYMCHPRPTSASPASPASNAETHSLASRTVAPVLQTSPKPADDARPAIPSAAAPTTSPVPDEAAASAASERVCAQKKQADATWQQINKDQDSGTELTRNAKQPAIEARRKQVDIDFAVKVNPLLAQGFRLKLNSAKVEPNEINYRHGLELGFTNDCYWDAEATIVPTDTAKRLLATVPPGTTLFVTAQLDTYEREYLFNKAHLNVTKITLSGGQTLATEPVVRTANEAKVDHREGETFIYCQARGGGMFECARISHGGRSDPL
jgi:hypothetical protein